MSEIFEFLKKTEAGRRKKSPVPEPDFDLPVAEPDAAPAAEPVAKNAAEESLPMDVEICPADRFDLSEASVPIKSVLNPLTMVGEQFRLLRSMLGLMQKQRGIKTVLITSTAPEEGKTFTSSSLAGVFAQEPGKRVVLIDADMRKPRSGSSFGINGSSSSSGLSSVLQGSAQFENALLTAANPEFCFLPSGPLPPNPTELLGSPMFEQTLRAAAKSFDWVILDSPPVLSLSDTTLIAPLCDTVVLVVRANSTPARLVEDAVNRIGRDRICGIVMNRQKRIRSSHYYYQYYYHSSKKQKE